MLRQLQHLTLRFVSFRDAKWVKQHNRLEDRSIGISNSFHRPAFGHLLHDPSFFTTIAFPGCFCLLRLQRLLHRTLMKMMLRYAESLESSLDFRLYFSLALRLKEWTKTPSDFSQTWHQIPRPTGQASGSVLLTLSRFSTQICVHPVWKRRI